MPHVTEKYLIFQGNKFKAEKIMYVIFSLHTVIITFIHLPRETERDGDRDRDTQTETDRRTHTKSEKEKRKREET